MSLIERAIAKLDSGANGQNPGVFADPAGARDDDFRFDSLTEASGENQSASDPEFDSTDDVSVHDASGAVVVSGGEEIKMDLSRIGAQAYLKPVGGERSKLIETFRHIKRPLLSNAYGQGTPALPNGRRIMVTSSLPGEGKTFTAIHLALSIASEIETNVILVDGDIIRPSVLSTLDVTERAGIADWFDEPRKPIHELVTRTNLDGLKILPAGKWKPNSAEVLASRSMAKFMNELSATYPNDIIIVDSPPLLPASESRALATMMGQVLLVVGAGDTSEAQVNQALEMLDGDAAVSLVLNRSRNSSAYANYGY